MSDILCKWLNQELRLSKAVEPKTLAKDFSTGYLIGEVLHKYQLQNDFSMFMRKDTSTSRLNNYTRLEPTLQLLGISFDKNTVQELTQEKPGIATRLLYQLYVSLEKKNRAEITGTVMEIMQPATNAGMHKREQDIYADRLHQLVKPDTELKLPKISQHYEEKYEHLNNRSVVTHPIQQKRPLKGQDEKVPKPPPYALQLNLKRRRQQQQRREQQAKMVQAEIAQFETNRKKMVTSGFASFSSGQPIPGAFPISGSSGTKLILQSNSKYIQEIRQRLEENAVAREQKEQRLDRFLVEQLKAHEAQEEARREEQLVKRLTRQTKQEQRLASQLLQIRLQKEVIQQNRLFREQQYQQRRERDFHEALEREAALDQQAKLERADEIRKELEFLNTIAAERAQSRYDKHFKICKDILEQIVDLATKVGEYRLITANLIPEKRMREWKELLISGLPLYEPIKGQQPGFELSTSLNPVELKKQEKLNNLDYDEYTNMVGEWTWPEEAGETKSPPTNNSFLGHVVLRVRNIVHPPAVELTSTSFPHFTLKACVLGKLCSGKTTCLAKIAKAHGICVLSADTLVEEALNAHHNGEEVTEPPEKKDSEQQLTSSTSLISDLDTQEEGKESQVKLSTRAMQGATAEKELRNGNAIPNELLVDIIVNAIRQVPARSGWILDGFPVDITQAHLLEKALGGSVDEGNGVESSRVNLAVDPDPPKPLPPTCPVLDLALLLDVPDETVVTRTFSHTDVDTAADTTSHPTDKNMYVAQIPHRITAFQDTWPKLEEWFGEKQNILVRVDANVVEEELYKNLESILQQVLMQKQDHVTPPVEHVLDSGKVPDSSTDEASRPRESKSSLHKGKAHRVNSFKKTCTLPAKGKTASSVTSEHKNSHESIYVDDPLPPGISEYLYTHWETICDSYVNNTKTVMQQLRSQSVVISHHLFNIREEFKLYLGRPDMRQELVTQWQKDFNSISDDMRDDEDTKAELHLRLDELRERLWDISDKRKEQDEQERTSVMTNGWLEEHSVILVNHHSILTQVELDRFQGTVNILRVYYFSMERHALPEPPTDFVCIRLLCIPEKNDQDKSTEPSVCSQLDDGEETKIVQFVPLLPKSPVSTNGVSKTPRKEEGQAQTEHVKTPQEKLVSDYEEALRAISKLVTGKAHQGETKEQESVQEKEEKEIASASSNKKGKGKAKQSPKKKQGPPSTPVPSPAPADEKKLEETHNEVRSAIQIELTAALDHEENATKVRIELVKGHGLMMMQRLQSKAEQAFGDMEKWLEAHFLSEMKSIDQLSEVVRHHIEAGAKLQKELRLECADFYLNGDCHMVASQVPPPRPPPLEKSTLCTPTIKQLESLHQQLRIIAPSGLMSSFEFSNLLRDVTSVNMGRNILPEPWMNMNERQLMEIASMLMDNCELIDWRRFLLSAALPWPFPSLTQLLAVLQRFKTADTGNRGFLNREQYLKTELWFSSETVQPVPEDPTEPLPYDRLANLRKYFFRLFADHSFSPPRLDYVSMLQYFAADPNPRQGFIRALSVVLGKHLKHSSPGHLVKSMPSMEEASELSLSELNGECKETPCPSSSSLVEQEVSIPALLAVIRHKVTKMKDGKQLPPGCPSKKEHTQHLVHIFRELGCKPENRVPFSILCRHPFIQGLMETSTHYQLVNIHDVLLARQGEGESNSRTLS
ncbi:sperm flagellar protein 2 isoform X2 [Scophthalmus maximus]|uniref:sperm flagellar protein 2 isoform X2 n=1 Tax=Scophthalmus maximus TaxID=52904 RepID=UPI001FA8E82B|nr:sperm flagellar protein 2 isoform X2 [Scophthalmus maximus]